MTATDETAYERHLRVLGTRNLRDIGGYPAGDGRRTRWRTVYRSDCLDRLTPEAQETLLDHGVRQIVDLRRADELEAYPNVFRESPRVRYTHVPLVDVDPWPRAGELAAMYRIYLDEHQARIGDVFRALLRPDGLPAVIHCAAGKDRTGVSVALLLAVAGVPNETIAEDYGLSEKCFSMRWEAIDDEARRGEIEWVVDDEAPVVECPPDAMLATLDHLERRYGGAEGYLVGSGIAPADLVRLRERLTEPAPRD